MSLKSDVTRSVLEILRPNDVDKLYNGALKSWWFSTRKKDRGGLRLTKLGFECFLKAEIKEYKIKFEQPIEPTNQLIIWLDHYIDCPFYLGSKEIYVFSESMAIQLVLFGGNIYKYGQARQESLKSS
jgi:hypothetical protein